LLLFSEQGKESLRHGQEHDPIVDLVKKICDEISYDLGYLRI